MTHESTKPTAHHPEGSTSATVRDEGERDRRDRRQVLGEGQVLRGGQVLGEGQVRVVRQLQKATATRIRQPMLPFDALEQVAGRQVVGRQVVGRQVAERQVPGGEVIRATTESGVASGQALARKRISLDTTNWAAVASTVASTLASTPASTPSSTRPSAVDSTRLEDRAMKSTPALVVDKMPAARGRSPRVVESLGAVEAIATAFVVSVFLAAAICL